MIIKLLVNTSDIIFYFPKNELIYWEEQYYMSYRISFKCLEDIYSFLSKNNILVPNKFINYLVSDFILNIYSSLNWYYEDIPTFGQLLEYKDIMDRYSDIKQQQPDLPLINYFTEKIYIVEFMYSEIKTYVFDFVRSFEYTISVNFEQLLNSFKKFYTNINVEKFDKRKIPIFEHSGIDLNNLTHLHQLYIFGSQLISWINDTNKPIYEGINYELTQKNIYEMLEYFDGHLISS